MLNKSEIMKKWKELSVEDKQMIGVLAGMSAGLFLKGILRCSKKDEVNLVIPKDCELMIFVKGGK